MRPETGAGISVSDPVYKANRRHEYHHVTQIRLYSTNDTIVVWDKKVQEAKDKGTEFKAWAATPVLWAATGNTSKKLRELTV
jgi:hypothetical protein